MENSGRIAELLAESLKLQDKMLSEQKETNKRLYTLEEKSDKVEEQLVRLNLQTSENTRAIMKLAERIEQIVDHEKRIAKLESIVLTK